MIRCALESPYLGQPFKYLGYYHITHGKYFRATWSWKMPQKLTKTQKFRESQLALKNKIWSFARFLKLVFTFTVRNVMIWCSLESSGLGRPFKYLERYHITRKKVFRALKLKNAWKTDQNSEISKISVGSEKQDLRHFSTSGGSKKISTGDMITLKIF